MRDIESIFINKIKVGTLKIGDDGVYLDNLSSFNSIKFNKRALCFSTDSFVEDTHFRLKWFNLDEISYKAMIVNISDTLAMGSKPKFALINAGLKSVFSNYDISLLANGFLRACKEFDIKIIGGDTYKSSLLNIGITIIGTKVKNISRKGIRAGDLIVYTKTNFKDIGSSFNSLNRLLRNIDTRPKNRFLVPLLQPKFIYGMSRISTKGMDISDGIFSSLNQLGKLNGLNFRFLTTSKIKILRNRALYNMFNSGEEYEMMFAIKQSNYISAKNRAKAHRIGLKKLCIATKNGIFKSKSKIWH